MFSTATNVCCAGKRSLLRFLAKHVNIRVRACFMYCAKKSGFLIHLCIYAATTAIQRIYTIIVDRGIFQYISTHYVYIIIYNINKQMTRVPIQTTSMSRPSERAFTRAGDPVMIIIISCLALSNYVEMSCKFVFSSFY